MRRGLMVCATALSMLTGACSGGGESSPSVADSVSDTVSLSTMPPGTVAPPPTEPTAASTTLPVVTATYPLTGLQVTDPAAAARPALVVKIDNHAAARPQTGLGVADIVFEENVEGITRFAAVFQSQGSDPVGPIRSGRTQDVAMLGSFDRPLFAWSGGNPAVTKAIANSDFVNLSNLILAVQRQGGFFRDSAKSNPHDLYAQTSLLWTLSPLWAPPPPQQFVYRSPESRATGDLSNGARVNMDGVRVDWSFDSGSGAYLRSQNGDPHTDAVSGPISAQNVVVLVVRYQPSAADSRSPEAQTLGSGDVFVFTDGVMVTGTWQRASRTDPFALIDSGGAVIELTPGRTWIELARSGAVTPTAG